MNRHERRREQRIVSHRTSAPHPLHVAMLTRAQIVEAIGLVGMAQTQSVGFGNCGTYASITAALLTTLTGQSHHVVVGSLTYRPHELASPWLGHIDCDTTTAHAEEFHAWAVAPSGAIIDVTVPVLPEHWQRTKPPEAPAWDRPDLPAFIWGDAPQWGFQYQPVTRVDQALYERWLLLEGKPYQDHLRGLRAAVRTAETILREPGDWRVIPNGNDAWGIARMASPSVA